MRSSMLVLVALPGLLHMLYTSAACTLVMPLP
jgi:hypothetical protein